MQRVAIASVLVMRPDVMILDEPTSQLDPEGSDEVFRAVETLTGSGITILMIEQKIEKLAAYCDRILLLHKGKQIAFDTPQKVFSMPDLNDYGIQAPAFTRICKAEQVTLVDGTYPVTVKEAAEVLREKRLGAHEHANAEAGVQKQWERVRQAPDRYRQRMLKQAQGPGSLGLAGRLKTLLLWMSSSGLKTGFLLSGRYSGFRGSEHEAGSASYRHHRPEWSRKDHAGQTFKGFVKTGFRFHLFPR